MGGMLRWHRLVAITLGLLLLYVVGAGLGIQMADLRALTAHAPATDPDMLMMRQHIDGPNNYAVVSAPDYTAPALPAGFDFAGALMRAAALGAAAAPGEPLRLVEVRTAAGTIAGHVQMRSRQLIFDLASGSPLPATALPPPQPGRGFSSTRSDFKYFHRFQFFGSFGNVLNLVVALAFAALLVTGLIHYTRLYRLRAKSGRRAPFWSAGDRWRRLHRWTAVGAGVLLAWLALSGLLLSLDNVGAYVHTLVTGPRAPGALDGDQSSPMDAAAIPAMTRTTLAAFAAAEPGTGIKVLRLRTFAGYPQGVVIAADRDTGQFVYNARTGAKMAMWEEGYPDLGYLLGWDWHEWLKRFHRGDLFGLPGRWLDLAGALSLLYLLVSGGVMYWRMWSRRRRAGKGELIWR